MENRIKCIDGWRAIAALGVLFTHVLGKLNHPELVIFSIDIFKVLNIWGSGVHLFFVISGFCFFLVMNKTNNYSLNGAFKFWKKRWLRIAPAYYFACVIYGLLVYGHFSKELIFSLFTNFIFLQTYIPGTEITAIFWSLSVEWIFYLLLPFLFILIQKFSIIPIVGLIILLGLSLNLLHFIGILYPGNFSWYYTIFANFEHFGWGILLGFIYLNKLLINSFLSGRKGFWFGLLLAYIGKIFFYSNFLNNTGRVRFIFESIGPLTMTLGFSIMMLSSLRHRSINKILACRPLVFIGRISFSFYLWHILIIQFSYRLLKQFISDTPMGVLILTSICLIFIIPISYISYTIFESFYFKSKKDKQIISELISVNVN